METEQIIKMLKLENWPIIVLSSQVVLVVNNLPVNAGDARDVGLIPGSGRYPRGEYGNTLQYSFLENPRDRGVWRAAVMGSQRVSHE